MSVTITFRDSGDWGAGKGAPLTVSEVDGNWWALKQAVEDLQGVAYVGESIETIEVIGAEMTLHGSNGTNFGTFTLPASEVKARGAWSAGRRYLPNDMVRYEGALFLCVANHTAASDWWSDQRGGRWVMLGGVVVPSPTSLTVATGTKTLEVPDGTAFAPSSRVRISQKADPAARSLEASVEAVTTDADGVTWLEVTVDKVTGSGTYAHWRVAASGLPGTDGATGPAGYTNPRGTWAASDYYYEHDVVVAPDGNGYRCYWEHASAIAWDDDRMFWRLYVQGAAASTGFGKRHGPLVDAGPIDRNDIVFTGETDNLMITDLGQGGGVFDLGGVA